MAKIKVPSKLPIKEIKCKDVYGQEYVISYTDAPMVEYAPVVRCRDCKWHEGAFCFNERMKYVVVNDDFFCADGERKDG